MKYFSRDEVEKIGRAGVHTRQEKDAVVCRVLSSFWLWCELDDTAFTPWMKTDGFWEAWITKWISGQFENHSYFVDVGANVGYYSLLAGKAGLTVTAVEPNPKAIRLLKTSLRENGIVNSEVLEGGMSNRRGTITICVPPGHSGGGSIIMPKHTVVDWEILKVKAYTFDDLTTSGESVLVKIDAEGAEPKIWAGMKKFRKRNRVTTILEWEASRYDAEKFATELFDDNEVKLVNFDGDEEDIDKDWLVNTKDLHMIVVR